ncbi:hypothetical protein BsWGS_15147 [Bradybaena similaris]
MPWVNSSHPHSYLRILILFIGCPLLYVCWSHSSGLHGSQPSVIVFLSRGNIRLTQDQTITTSCRFIWQSAQERHHIMQKDTTSCRKTPHYEESLFTLVNSAYSVRDLKFT